jgi:hypothetical protein
MSTYQYICGSGPEGVPVAYTQTETTGQVRYAWQFCEESIDASREYNLVNAHWGKVSRAKKWDKWERRHGELPYAKEVSPGEFLIS